MTTQTDLVLAGKLAKEVYELATAEAVQCPAPLHFWSKLLNLILAEESCVAIVKPKVSEVKEGSVNWSLDPMTDAEVTEFEKKKMPFGVHQDTRIRDVPADYLAWLADQNNFTKQVIRYVRSKKFQDSYSKSCSDSYNDPDPDDPMAEFLSPGDFT